MPTKEQFEASWGWDDKKGSIPYKRLPLSDKNIKAQAELARPGKLIHWSGKMCKRGLAKVDVRTVKGPVSLDSPRKENATLGPGSITYMAEAGHIENVNCLACRWLYFAAQRDRAARKKEAKVVRMLASK